MADREIPINVKKTLKKLFLTKKTDNNTNNIG